MTGLARSTVTQRLDQLLAERLGGAGGGAAPPGGRPPSVLAFNRGAGVVLAADLGATHSRLALTDLGGEVLGEVAGDLPIADGPEVVLGWVEAGFDGLLDGAGRTVADVRGIGIG